MSIINSQNPWIGGANALNEGANTLADTLLRIPFLKAQLQQAGLQAQNTQLNNQLLQGQVQQQPQLFAQQQQQGAANLQRTQGENQGQDLSNLQAWLTSDNAKPLADLQLRMGQAKTSEAEAQAGEAGARTSGLLTSQGNQKKIGDAVARILTSKLTGQQPNEQDVAAAIGGMAGQGNPAADAGVLQMFGMGKPNNAAINLPAKVYGSTMQNPMMGLDPLKTAAMVPQIMQLLQGLGGSGGQGGGGMAMPAQQPQSTNTGGTTNWLWTPQGLVPQK